MSTYRLDSIFRPRAVAVVGSQSRPRSVGRAVVENLLASGFSGPIGLVNKHPSPMDGVAMAQLDFFGDGVDAHATNARRGPAEIFIDQVVV